MMRKVLVGALLGGLLFSGAAFAQNTSEPSTDWNSNWNFSSTGSKSLRLIQADLIAKMEEGYYDSFGKVDAIVTNNVYYDNSTGNVEVSAAEGSTVTIDAQVGDEIGQNTNVIGAINTSNTEIDVSGDGNTVTATNGAEATGCQSGNITIDSDSSPAGTSTCN